MQKKILVTALAALIAAPVIAQADVKVYGSAQVEIGRVKNDGKVNTSFNNNPVVPGDEKTVVADSRRGRFGIAASEDWMWGMKGVAKFEFRMDTADGNDNVTCAITEVPANPAQADTCAISPNTTPLQSRDAYAGVEAKWGTLLLGRRGSPYKNVGNDIEPFLHTLLEARSNFGMSSNADGFGVLGGHNNVLSDGAFYTSPTLGGVQVDAYMGADGTGTSANATTGSVQAQSSQTNGDYSVVVAWSGDFGAVTPKIFVGRNELKNAIGREPEANKIGAKIGIAKIHQVAIQWEETDSDQRATGGAPITGDEGEYLFLGYQLSLGAFKIALNWGQFENDTTQEGDYWAAGGFYNFSKKSFIFLGARSTELTGTPDGSDADAIAGDTDRDELIYSTGLRVGF